MKISKFFNEIKNAKIEREVEDVYNKGISMYFLKDDGFIEHPFACDGLLIQGFLKLLIEYKFNEELQNPVSRAKVLVQVVYYLKKFEENGDRLPNVIMVGDINEVFVLHSNCLLGYLDEQLNWNIAPSSAHEQNPNLIMKIAKDENINPFVWTVDENFSFKEVADKINDLAMHIKRQVRITEHNIAKIFDYFTQKVILNSIKIAPNDLVGIFISAIIDKNNCYKHPNNPNILVANGKQIQINGRNFDSFFGYFQKEYTPEEKYKFTEISDRLIEDTKRRRSGEFYTPTLFTDYAHKMLSEQLGNDWKEKYVVWDCCWGTGNLTRDYYFKELYASTLEQGELDLGNRYNKEATKFVFDFLNDDISNLFGCKLPPKLYEALEQDKPIVFFINPPYGTASANMGASGKGGKGQGTCLTRINKQMVEENIGSASNNLFAQFLYRIYLIKEQFKLTNIHIGLFCNPVYLCGSNYKKFRNVFFDNFSYKKGILFNAGYFSDVSSNWGINFSVWSNGTTEEKSFFKHFVVEETDDELKIIGEKSLYNLDVLKDGKSWIKEPIMNIKETKEQRPPLSSAITMKYGKNSKTTVFKSALGSYLNIGNDVYNNEQKVALFTSCDNSNANGISVMEKNFDRIITMFSSRRLISDDYITHLDQYLAPNEHHKKYQEFVKDSIVYSLFESKSQQSSLRDIEYKNQKWNIKNEFFYMSKNAIMELANKYNLDYTYNDAKVSQERFVYNKLQQIKLSPQAQAVLDKAIELTKKSFQYRELFNSEFPQYQVLNWDCGWYQIKAILKQYLKQDLDEFSKVYKTLADKMKPVVYELGFLKK